MTLRGSRLQGRKPADTVAMARELALEVEPEGVTELPQSHDTNLNG